jgi:hypothetical protein
MSEISPKPSKGMFQQIPAWRSNRTKPPGESYTLPLEMETQRIPDIQTLPEKPGREDGVGECWQRNEKNLLEITGTEFETIPAIAQSS